MCSGDEILLPHRIGCVNIGCVYFASLMAQVSSRCPDTEQGAPFLSFWSPASLPLHTPNISVLCFDNSPSLPHWFACNASLIIAPVSGHAPPIGSFWLRGVGIVVQTCSNTTVLISASL